MAAWRTKTPAANDSQPTTRGREWWVGKILRSQPLEFIQIPFPLHALFWAFLLLPVLCLPSGWLWWQQDCAHSPPFSKLSFRRSTPRRSTLRRQRTHRWEWITLEGGWKIWRAFLGADGQELEEDRGRGSDRWLCTWETLAEVSIAILKEVETTNKGNYPRTGLSGEEQRRDRRDGPNVNSTKVCSWPHTNDSDGVERLGRAPQVEGTEKQWLPCILFPCGLSCSWFGRGSVYIRYKYLSEKGKKSRKASNNTHHALH